MKNLTSKIKRSGLVTLIGISALLSEGCNTTPSEYFSGSDDNAALGLGLMALGDAKGYAPAVNVGRAIVDLEAAERNRSQVNVNIQQNPSWQQQPLQQSQVYQGPRYGRTGFSTPFLLAEDYNGDGICSPNELVGARDTFFISEANKITLGSAIRNKVGYEWNVYLFVPLSDKSPFIGEWNEIKSNSAFLHYDIDIPTLVNNGAKGKCVARFKVRNPNNPNQIDEFDNYNFYLINK